VQNVGATRFAALLDVFLTVEGARVRFFVTAL
jgi:hypothetical protein